MNTQDKVILSLLKEVFKDARKTVPELVVPYIKNQLIKRIKKGKVK
jgi:hypothetical protein